jgi:hypothetical protein
MRVAGRLKYASRTAACRYMATLGDPTKVSNHKLWF